MNFEMREEGMKEKEGKGKKKWARHIYTHTHTAAIGKDGKKELEGSLGSRIDV